MIGGNVACYTGKAQEYASCRPPYAPGVSDAITELTGLDPCWCVADIASGTGALSELLLGRVRTLYAVEPNADMRECAEARFRSTDGFQSRDGLAEATGLADGSVDLIVVGQALHWFDRDAALREFARIVRPPGWLATVWNHFGGTKADVAPFFAERVMVTRNFPMTLEEDWGRYIGGARSTAGSPLPGTADYAEFEARHRECFDRNAREGVLSVDYTTCLVVGRPAAP